MLSALAWSAPAQSQPFVPSEDKEARGAQLQETLKAAGPVKGGPDQVRVVLCCASSYCSYLPGSTAHSCCEMYEPAKVALGCELLSKLLCFNQKLYCFNQNQS